MRLESRQFIKKQTIYFLDQILHIKMVLTKDNNFVINGDSEVIKNLEIFKDMNFEEIDFYVFYVNYLSKKETENKKVLVGYNGIDGKEVTISKLKEDINEIRDSRSRHGRKEKSQANEQSSIIGRNSVNITVGRKTNLIGLVIGGGK